MIFQMPIKKIDNLNEFFLSDLAEETRFLLYIFLYCEGEMRRGTIKHDVYTYFFYNLEVLSNYFTSDEATMLFFYIFFYIYCLTGKFERAIISVQINVKRHTILFVAQEKGRFLMKKFIGLVGTNSDESTNRKLLQYIKKHFADKAEIELVEIKDIPLFNKPADRKVPEIVKEIADKIEKSDGVIISTPEYDHSAPAALINALNWLSYGIYPFVDKPVMITGASFGTLGSSRAQAQLRQVLDAPELKARIMPSSEYLLGHSLQAFDPEGNLMNAEQVEKLNGLFEDFLNFVEITSHLNHNHAANKKAAENFDWATL